MAHFEVGDKVRISETGKVGKIVAHPNEYEYDVVLEGENTPYPYEGHELTLAKSLPATATKAMELRAKYKAAPSKRDMVLIGEWNAPESGPGTFYAPRSRRSQVERTFLAIEEGDESKEAFYSVINAGGVFIRD